MIFEWILLILPLGYRDAQCGWVVSRETLAGAEPGAEQRTVAFLVIYIAKRGLMEIWTAQQGTRVAAFNCSKSAKLVPPNSILIIT